jgi:hypothetical protein
MAGVSEYFTLLSKELDEVNAKITTLEGDLRAETDEKKEMKIRELLEGAKAKEKELRADMKAEVDRKERLLEAERKEAERIRAHELALEQLRNVILDRESYQRKALLESIDPFHEEISIQRLSGTSFSDNYIAFVALETEQEHVRKACLITGRACSHQVLNKKSGEYKPRGCVIADHILELNRSSFNMKTICRMHNKMNDERNCMFLLEGLEHLFHNGRITLLPVNPTTPRVYKLCILDQSVITV